MNRKWWSREWFMGTLVVAGFALTLRFEPLAGIEGWVYDLASGLSAPATHDEGVVVVAVDELAQEEGAMLRPYEQARRLLDLLNQGAPRAVVLFWPLEHADNATVISWSREAESLLQKQPSGDAAPLLQKMAALAKDDQRLAQAMRSIDRLFLAPSPSVSVPRRWQWSVGELVTLLPPESHTPSGIEPLFTTSVYGVAADTALSDGQPVMRRVPLRYRQSDGTSAYTLPLQLLALRQQIEPLSIHPAESEEIALGGKSIITTAGGYVYPRWSRSGPQILNASDLTKDSARLGELLRGRVVMAGPISAALTPRLTLPDGRRVAPVEMAALTLTALNTNELLQLPSQARWVQLATLLGVALLLVGIFPRLTTGPVLAAGLVVLVVIVNTQLLMMLMYSQWLLLTTPTLALVTGGGLLVVRRRLSRHLRQVHEQLGRVTVALAQQLRHQGHFDEALLHLQQCPIGPASEELYHLGLDYERKRQFNKAEQVFAYLAGEKPRFKDAAERARLNREASERIIIAGHPSSNMTSTLVLDQQQLQKPTVGRYQIERELGRGAMGMVYLGHDPKISRTVAIKTVTLALEYGEQQLAQVRERFFREAESAGRLSHPHIVTIYDVGEEGDLAYIAMDYLPGVSLDHHTSQENLLPVEEVMAIILQVADALDYAHENGVIHRDIKPANIIYDRDRREATVTDFGVAHLADASKTRTGTILGSPYYMAPEQLAGAKVDGRADLFSLGVTFYQLLTGAVPFEADSIATLMYKIAHSRHVSVSKLRRGVPACASRIVNQLLQKDVERRYQSGRELHKALQRCLK